MSTFNKCELRAIHHESHRGSESMGAKIRAPICSDSASTTGSEKSAHERTELGPIKTGLARFLQKLLGDSPASSKTQHSSLKVNLVAPSTQSSQQQPQQHPTNKLGSKRHQRCKSSTDPCLRAASPNRTPSNPLFCKTAPTITIEEYITRFSELGDLDDQFFVTTYIYIKKTIKKLKVIDHRFVHKLIAAWLYISQKFLIDGSKWKITEFSRLAGVSPSKLRRMERYLLHQVIEFELFFRDEEYEHAERCLVAFSRL